MTVHRQLRVALVTAASLLCVSLAAAPALANDGYGPSILFFGMGSGGRIHGLPMTLQDNQIELGPLQSKHLRLENGGTLAGGGFQVGGYIDGVRTGLGISVFAVEGAHLRHDALGNDFFVEASGAWGASVQLHLGYEMLRGPFRPYLDLVGSWNGVALNIDLKHPDYGQLGRTGYQGWLFGFGPRAGFSIPLGETAFLDLSGTYSFVGMERFRIAGGIGFWAR